MALIASGSNERRDLWQAEWETAPPPAFQLAAAVLTYSVEVDEKLQVNADRVQANFGDSS
jgi:hypothetical protein